MSRMDRREFLERTAVAAGIATLGGSLAADAETVRRPRAASDRVPFGKTSLKVSLLGVGTGTVGWNRQSNQTRMGREEFTRLVRHACDRGVTFFDCADMYGSHPYLKTALKGIPREKVTIQSKVISRDPKQARADIDRFRRELGTDYLDSLLMHVVTEETWTTDYSAVRDVLAEAKQRGAVRHHGCSCHGIRPLRSAASSPWVEVNMARINHKGAHMDAPPETVVEALRAMRAAGKAVVGMKILGQGDIGSDEEKDESLRFVLGSGAVDAIVVGFETPEQIDDMIARIDRILSR